MIQARELTEEIMSTITDQEWDIIFERINEREEREDLISLDGNAAESMYFWGEEVAAVLNARENPPSPNTDPNTAL